jgi:hypothetical protein
MFPMGNTLYDITNDFLTVYNMIDDGEIDEQVILDTLEGIQCSFEDKADGFAKMIKSLENRVNGISEEIKRLNSKKTTTVNKINWLKSQLAFAMRSTGNMKFSTTLFNYNIQKNGGKRTLTVDAPIDDIPERFRVKQPDTVDGEAVREYLAEIGHDYCEFAHLEPQTESLRIR